MSKIFVEDYTELFHVEPYNVSEVEQMLESRSKVVFLDKVVNTNFMVDFEHYLDLLEFGTSEDDSFNKAINFFSSFVFVYNHKDLIKSDGHAKDTTYGDIMETIRAASKVICVAIIKTKNVAKKVSKSEAFNVGEIKTSIYSRETKYSPIFGLQTQIVMYKQTPIYNNLDKKIDYNVVATKRKS